MNLTSAFFLIASLGHDITMLVLVVLSIVSISFILERLVFFYRVSKNSKALRIALQESLGSDDHSQVQECAASSEGYEAEALKYGLRHLKKTGTEGLEEVFNSYILSVKPELDRFLNMLATIGSNAPFIGLLGTVFGVMEAFRALANSAGNSDPTIVMAGISEALAATAIGLIVAIPATIFYNYFQKRSKTVTNTILNLKDICLVYKNRWSN